MDGAVSIGCLERQYETKELRDTALESSLLAMLVNLAGRIPNFRSLVIAVEGEIWRYQPEIDQQNEMEWINNDGFNSLPRSKSFSSHCISFNHCTPGELEQQGNDRLEALKHKNMTMI